MYDERQGMPSASEIERLDACSASFLRSKNQPDKTSEVAQAGTRIHEAVEKGDTTGLTIAEENLVNKCNRLAAIVRDECDFLESNEYQLILEQRIWYSKNGSILYSGKPDYVAIDKNRALVIDYKTGYLETISAEKNLQLRAIAVLVKKNFPDVKEIYVSIVQPNLEPGYTVSKYDNAALDYAENQIIKIIEAAMVEDADANPGEKQCRYCKAKPICKEAQAESFEIIKSDPATLDLAQLPELLDKCDLADRVIKAIRDAALDVVKDGGIVEGWEIGKTSKSRSFVSTAAVFHAVSDVIDRDAFANACDIKLNALETAWLDATDDEETKKSRLESLRMRLEPITVYKDKQARKLKKLKA